MPGALQVWGGIGISMFSCVCVCIILYIIVYIYIYMDYVGIIQEVFGNYYVEFRGIWWFPKIVGSVLGVPTRSIISCWVSIFGFP